MYQPDKDLSEVGATPRFHEFADAIRRGCVLRPIQCFGMLYDSENSACALGAARAAGYDEGEHTETGALGDCPVDDCSETAEMIYDLVPHLNDAHRWTREAIADWLETL